MSLRNLQLPSEIIAKLGVSQIEDITDKLPINPKNSWAQLAGTRELENLTTIALHHDAYPKANTVKYSNMELATNMANDHINNVAYDPTGEGGIPYHIWIRGGLIYQCNDILDRTYGVASNNGYTVHICVSGDYYNYDTLTDVDRNALYAAIIMVKSVLPNFKEIKGHKELNPTDCPGYDVNRVRLDVQTIENQLEYEKSAAGKKAVAYSIANQILYLANLCQGKDSYGNPATPGNIEYGTNMLMELKQFMDDHGLKY